MERKFSLCTIGFFVAFVIDGVFAIFFVSVVVLVVTIIRPNVVSDSTEGHQRNAAPDPQLNREANGPVW